jgi:hypothetical protein
MAEQAQALNDDQNSPADETLNAVPPSGIGEEDYLERQDDLPPEDHDDDTQEDKADEPKGPIPYERFQEKVKSEQALKAKQAEHEAKIAELEAKIAERGQHEKAVEPPPAEREPQGTAESLPFVNMAQKTDDELQAWLDEKPLNFISNLAAQIQHETILAMREEFGKQERTRSLSTNLQKFADENEGFETMFKAGELKRFADQNPGYDVFSAYYALTKENREKTVQQKIDEAVKKAKEEAQKEFEKNIKTKREIRNLDATPASTPPDPNATIRDTGGDLVSGLAARLKSLRRKD